MKHGSGGQGGSLTLPGHCLGRREGLEGSLGISKLGQGSSIPMTQLSGCTPGALPGK